ncbi:hypothetical protein DL89DRAFT_28239 [Linderina pennispora]|uniref:Uncharacterized protein n=1 Tax=Linderina pennispora TaxID=61395 RepID=A0A1Y1W3T7_9FUNG|nr:uncharacterized protein DL89DRAFT_28239 [Linderina pennispora]ORX68223.1 hypothetical protein DL89DRAFT_28239 [Linderina pennispora]
MSNSDHTRSSPAGNSSSMYGAESPVATQTPHSGGGTDYRTSIQFLTSSTSQPSHDVSADVIMEEEPSSSVPVSALLAPQDNHRQAITVPARTQYREDELTGMQGLMELASPEHTPLSPEHTPLRPIINHGVHSASSSASSGSTSTFSVPPALNISSHGGSRPANTLPPMQAHQRFHTYHSATTMAGSPASAATTLTPDSMPSVTPGAVRSFPATLDDSRMARRRSQSTDSPHHQQSGGLPHVLGNANIRDRSFTFTQRQRTSDTPLFPILLHRYVSPTAIAQWEKSGMLLCHASGQNA